MRVSECSCRAEPVPCVGNTGLLTLICFLSPSLPCCVSSETLPVEYMGGKPLCMNQYYQILSSCRIPGPKRDSIVNYAKGTKQSRHITVVHNFQVGQLLGFQGLLRCRYPFCKLLSSGKGITESLCPQGLPHRGFFPTPFIPFGQQQNCPV